MSLGQTQTPGIDKFYPQTFPHIFSNKVLRYFYVL